jgi:GntR family transcriptional repressor for pyruvate dehydrogenase complex
VTAVRPEPRPEGDGAQAGRTPPLSALEPPPATGVAVRRVRKAYEQVADQLRELVMTGELAPGERLPNEALLARDFGVSRATIREALRVLAAQNLLRTAKGAGGGSYVTVPSVRNISDFLRSNINLLTGNRDVTLEELIEARILLEVPAARLAAKRRGEGDVERLRAAIPLEAMQLDTQEEFVRNSEFHTTVIECSRNTLLFIAVQPVFSALQTNLSRSVLGRGFHRETHRAHERITDAIEACDEHAAGEEMRVHLEYLVPFYEKAWRDLRHGGRARRAQAAT